MRTLMLGALSWEPEIKGALYVAIAVGILVGSAYLLLMTNLGARLGFQLTLAGFFGWMTVLGAVWWVYGKGPIGDSPTWQVKSTVVGEPGASKVPALAGFPNGWEKLDTTAPEVADATPSADTVLVGKSAPFQAASDYVLVGAEQKGGERYGPFDFWPFNHRPFNLFHKVRYVVIQVQKSTVPPAVAGQPPPKAVADPSAPPVSVLMVRNLGSVRFRPALVCIFSGLMFSLVCYLLHVRDKEAAAARG